MHWWLVVLCALATRWCLRVSHFRLPPVLHKLLVTQSWQFGGERTRLEAWAVGRRHDERGGCHGRGPSAMSSQSFMFSRSQSDGSSGNPSHGEFGAGLR